MTGGGALTLFGGGTLFLTNNTNSYTGVTTVSSGILNVTQAASLGASVEECFMMSRCGLVEERSR